MSSHEILQKTLNELRNVWVVVLTQIEARLDVGDIEGVKQMIALLKDNIRPKS